MKTKINPKINPINKPVSSPVCSPRIKPKIKYPITKSGLLFIFLVGKSLLAEAVLDQYIRVGLEKNQSLYEKNLKYEKSKFAVKEAQTLFFPKVSLLADYLHSKGGRTVDFPVGDLLNPVNQTLNQLTGTNNFPTLENQSFPLVPQNYYDAKIRASLPIFNLEIIYNQQLQSKVGNLYKIEFEIAKRELIKEIKVAYFNYLKAESVVQVYRSALENLREAKRVNESLFQTGKSNYTHVLRSQSEIDRWISLLEGVQNQKKSAQGYFNFLLNRDLEESILTDSNLVMLNVQNSDSVFNTELDELKKIKISQEIAQKNVGLSQANYIPSIVAFGDIGAQSNMGNYDTNSDYYRVGVSLEWEIFASGNTWYKAKQAKTEKKIAEIKFKEVYSQLKLLHRNVLNEFKNSLNLYESGISHLKSSNKIYQDILKQYREGGAIYIELLDAQNQMVQANLQLNIAFFDMYIKKSELERINASFNIGSIQNEQ